MQIFRKKNVLFFDSHPVSIWYPNMAHPWFSFVVHKGVLVISELHVYFAAMYFKVSMRTNPSTGVYSGYNRLVESYRNNWDMVCHRTILNAGYLDGLTTDELNLIQKLLSLKVANHDKPYIWTSLYR